jgi:hypothetical protein
MGLIFGSKVSTEVLPFDKIKEINKIEANIENFIYLKSRILTCDEPNGNGDFLPSEEVKKSYKTFIGKIVDYNHNTNQILGKIIDADYIEGKNGEHDSVDIICKIDKSVYPEYISRIISGDLCQMSMEAYAENAQCGFCGERFQFAEPCEHIKSSMNKKLVADSGEEKLVYRIDLDLTFVGAGIVENPADKKAQMQTVLAKKDRSAEEILKNINAYDLIRISDAVNSMKSGMIEEIVAELDKKIDIPIFENELTKYLEERLTAMEINEIKNQLIKKGKLISNLYGAHLITIDNDNFWLITKNGLPSFKQSIKAIWGNDLENDEIKIDGMDLKEYAKSDLFKRRLLATIQTEGLDYIKEIWGILEEPERTWEDVVNLKATSTKWQKQWKSYGEEFYNCVKKARNWTDSPEAYCAWLEHEATGEWPRERSSKRKVKSAIDNEEIKNIEAFVIKNKDKFKECVEANKNNKNIEVQEGQTFEEALESYCYNKTLGLKASLELKDLVEQDLINDDVLGGKENFKAYIDYKCSGQWPLQASKRVRIKLFSKEFNKLSEKDKSIFSENIPDITINFPVHPLASKKEAEKLIKNGMTEKEIKELYNIRFGG